MYFGAVLKNIRESKGFSLLEIQKKTGIKESQLCRIESGTRFPTDEQIFILAAFFNLDANQLQIQRDSDKILEAVQSYQNPNAILEVAKQKLESNGNYLSVAADSIQGAAIPLESRRYIGCKQKLVDWIFDIIQNETTGIKTATDIFAGTGVVAKKMLSLYDNVIINDFLFSNNQIYKAFFAVGKWNKEKILKKIELYNSLDEANLGDNYFSLNFGGKYFDYDMAKKIGWIREDIENSKSDLTEKEYAILLTTLMYNIDKHANTLGHFEAYIKKPIKKAKLLLRPIDVNEFKNVTIYRQDSNELARKIKSDLVYIDPPYNSRQYSRFYHVYETLVKWNKPVLVGTAMKPPLENMSNYCNSQAPKTFADLIENLNAKYLVVSYNNTYNSKSGSLQNKITLHEIEEILGKKGKVSKVLWYNDEQEILFLVKAK